MKTIGTEEHFVTDEVVAAWSRLGFAAREDSWASVPPGEVGERLREVGERRIAAMDEAGLDVQVISLTSPGLHNLPADEATRLQVDTNERIAEFVNAHPDRFQGFATLAVSVPVAAAQELERAVTKLGLNGALLFGRTGERNLDHPDNWPISRSMSAETPTSQPAASTASATYGGRSRWPAWSASCSRPITRTVLAPTVASSTSSRPRGSIELTRSGSPPATGMRSRPASGADHRPEPWPPQPPSSRLSRRTRAAAHARAVVIADHRVRRGGDASVDSNRTRRAHPVVDS